MQNLTKVKCIIGEQDIKVKIFYTGKQELQISINSPNQEAARFDKYLRGFVSKEKNNHRNW
jgi:hypothetical protein